MLGGNNLKSVAVKMYHKILPTFEALITVMTVYSRKQEIPTNTL